MTTRCINSRSLSLSLSPQQRRRRLNSPRCVMLASRARTRGSMTTCLPCSRCWGRSLPCTISLFLPPFILAFYRWKIPLKSISPHKFSVPKCRRGLQYGKKISLLMPFVSQRYSLSVEVDRMPFRVLCSTSPHFQQLLFGVVTRSMGGSVAKWLACSSQAQKGPGSNRSCDAVW